MKEIKIRQDFGIYELGSEAEITPILGKIDLENNNEIRLDLTGCLPDYPATSRLIDEIIRKLKSIEGKKRLVILLEYMFSTETIVNWLLLGSKELKIECDKALSLKEINQLVIESLQGSNIEITVRVIENDTDGEKDAIIFR